MKARDICSTCLAVAALCLYMTQGADRPLSDNGLPAARSRNLDDYLLLREGEAMMLADLEGPDLIIPLSATPQDVLAEIARLGVAPHRIHLFYGDIAANPFHNIIAFPEGRSESIDMYLTISALNRNDIDLASRMNIVSTQ